jgi:crotonobetainyl-CoA:carnitine CoA-transferase CaiB-like acyl-CoA transferase
MRGIAAPRVLDVSDGIAGAYAALLLAQTGADVVRVEPAAGDPLRRWRHGDEPAGDDGALYEYLRRGQQAVRLEGARLEGAGLQDDGLGATGADLIVATPAGTQRDAVRAAVAADPGLVVVAITPYGLDGPSRDRPATDFTLQADSGALAIRGWVPDPPYQLGGRTSLWLAGAFAAAATLAVWDGRRRGGPGALVDLSIAEVANNGSANFMEVFHFLQHGPGVEPSGAARVLELPSIEPTADGWVGFNTNSPHMIAGFLRMVGRPDLAETGELSTRSASGACSSTRRADGAACPSGPGASTATAARRSGRRRPSRPARSPARRGGPTPPRRR